MLESGHHIKNQTYSIYLTGLLLKKKERKKKTSFLLILHVLYILLVAGFLSITRSGIYLYTYNYLQLM